jgi:chemotaxis protein MotB
MATAPPPGPSTGTASARSVKPATSEARAEARAVADAKVIADRLRDENQAGERPPARESAEPKDAKGAKAAAQQAMAEAADLRRSILRVLAEAGLAQGPKLEVSIVDEGLLISLTDDFNFGMFAIGSAEPQPRVVRAMEKIGELLAAQPGGFVVRGHTDSRAYKSRAYDNWRLSSARAQMAAYMLMRGKLDEKRIERIEGHADRALRNTADPLAAENRRIEILLRRSK